MRSIVAFVVLGLAPVSSALAQPDLVAGQRGYAVCAGCHGFAGEGNALVQAPPLAGLDSWYVARQMQYFATGIRGAANPDTHGLRMAQMAGAVRGARELDDLVAYVATLPVAASPEGAVRGSPEEGRRRYAVCAACHGVRGEGNADLSAPAVAGLPDWYVVRQLELYAEGARGAHADDVYGQQMRALAGAFADDAARRDLAAYITSLER